MNMNTISYRYIVAIAILALVFGYAAVVSAQAGLTGIPGGSTICYPDGCAVLNFQTTKAEWDALAGNKATLAETFETLIQMAISGGDVINELTRDPAGRIVWVACGNSHTHALYYSPSCTITFDKNPIEPDGDTTLRWSSTNAPIFYINNIGYVGASGSATIAPEETTDYSGYVNNAANGAGTTVPCSAILTVAGGAEVACPLGYEVQDGECVFVACPSGYVKQGNSCVLSNLCTTPPKCVGTNLVNSCTNATIQACAYGCASGACNPPPALSATLKATPSLLHIGATTNLTWTSENASSCTVVGNNGDSWSGTSFDGQVSSPIQGETTFTLHCVGVSGSVPPTVDKTEVVDIIPQFNEK